jgi:hypothetical protein
MNRDGWPDLAIVSHKSGSDHNTVSKLFWGHKKGFLHLPPTLLPTVGSHQLQGRNIGHVADRGPGVAYVTVPFAYSGLPDTLSWKGATPGRTSLTFQVRTSQTEEALEQSQWSRPMVGNPIDLKALKLPAVGWIQCRVDFVSPDGGLSPTLSEVSVGFE